MSERRFDPVQFTEAAREGWNSAALGWKMWAPTIEAGAQVVNDRLVELAGLQPGQKVLDIATGYGEPLVTAAQRVAPGGRAVATDLAPEMIRLAQERVAGLGLDNVVFHVCNGEVLDIPESDFDAALCRWGLMLMSDPDACLRRVHELLKPDGRVAMAVFNEPATSPFVAVAGGIVRREVGLGPPSSDEPGIFRLADVRDLRERFEGAGFRNVMIEQVGGMLEFDSAQDLCAIHSRQRAGYSPLSRRAACGAPRGNLADGCRSRPAVRNAGRNRRTRVRMPLRHGSKIGVRTFRR